MGVCAYACVQMHLHVNLGCALVLNLANDKLAAGDIAEAGGIARIFSAMDMYGANPKVQECACGTVRVDLCMRVCCSCALMCVCVLVIACVYGSMLAHTNICS